MLRKTKIDTLSESDLSLGNAVRKMCTDYEIKITHTIPLSEIIMDFSEPMETRIEAYSKYYESDIDDANELINKLVGMYSFSGTRNIGQFLDGLCNSSISEHVKVEAVKGLLSFEEQEEDCEDEEDKDVIDESNKGVISRNKVRKDNAYSALNKICMNLSVLPTPCKLEMICMLLENPDYTTDGIKYFTIIVNDKTLNCEYRYKAILSLELRVDASGKITYDKWKIQDREVVIRDIMTSFLFNQSNSTVYRILSCQYLLQKSRSNSLPLGDLCSRIENELLVIAKDNSLGENIRADAADTLLNLGSAEMVIVAKEIIMCLGMTRSSGNALTLFDNSQNVHTIAIEESVAEILGKLIQLPIMKCEDNNIDYYYVSYQIQKLLTADKETYLLNKVSNVSNVSNCVYCGGVKTEYCSAECERRSTKEMLINISLNRIEVDRILYSRYSQSLANILVRLWSYIQTQEDKVEAMTIRLLEELVDMSGTCSSGLAERLINVLSGFGEFNIRISWEDQIIANFVGRLNASIRNIPKAKYSKEKLTEIVRMYIDNEFVVELLTLNQTYYDSKLGSIKHDDDDELDIHKYISQLRTEIKLELLHKDQSGVNSLGKYIPLTTVTVKKLLSVWWWMYNQPSIDEYVAQLNTEKLNLILCQFQSLVLNELTLQSHDYEHRKHFLMFFRHASPSILTELEDEFQEHVERDMLDLYLKKAVMKYEDS